MPNDGFEPEQANMSVSQDPHHTKARIQCKEKVTLKVSQEVKLRERIKY